MIIPVKRRHLLVIVYSLIYMLFDFSVVLFSPLSRMMVRCLRMPKVWPPRSRLSLAAFTEILRKSLASSQSLLLALSPFIRPRHARYCSWCSACRATIASRLSSRRWFLARTSLYHCGADFFATGCLCYVPVMTVLVDVTSVYWCVAWLCIFFISLYIIQDMNKEDVWHHA